MSSITAPAYDPTTTAQAMAQKFTASTQQILTGQTQVAGATAGQVRPGDTTWRKLTAAVPAGFEDLRVLQGSRIVYIAATAQQAATTAAANLTRTPRW